MNRILLIAILFGFSLTGMSQEDSTKTIEHRNIIRWNLTPMFVVGPKSLVLGYERVIGTSQSISLNVGYLELSQRVNVDGEPVQFFDDIKKGGFDVSLDYRFYFKNRNKYAAPDGLYWGPYASVYNLNFEGKSKVFDNLGNEINQVGVDASLTMYSLGAQLGYQFIIKKRFSIDLMLVGPSFTRYAFKMGFDADNALNPGDPFYKGLEAVFSRLIPGSEIILDGVDYTKTGSTNFNYYGFRYGIQFGYVF